MSAAAEFRRFHQPGNPFVLANAWDRGSARMLEAMGARAIGTSSAAHAFTLGLPDGGHVSRDDAITHAADLGQAVAIPVSADLENGYGPSAADVVATVVAAADAGLAGCCIEDTALPEITPYTRQEAVRRIEAAVTAARAADDDFFLVARADGVMLGTYDLDEAIARVQAFAAAGANGVYIPVLPDLEAVRRVCESVDVPVNVLAVGRLQHHSLAEFGDAGVARVSLGSALARKTHRAIIEGGRPIFEEGSFAGLIGGTDGDIVDALLER
ncbi:MAG: isocitrate lyase/phosphoenolpyruvate mutase family protein [Acidimicrobiia bacterium]|nr:isocitrate lyase/phosphoenolpyruvate mutase family protein [Acidimicrobiia bacterium]MDH4307999.1 isocitrate lyase/phosphoenolpyruvate mutase family protein [Acidimicrobiia bacterium]MDH5292435.1 isocitrate lyase/phosphoenolpyruvate mutase family protein [Acidimicrobiia bacterium]